MRRTTGDNSVIAEQLPGGIHDRLGHAEDAGNYPRAAARRAVAKHCRGAHLRLRPLRRVYDGEFVCRAAELLREDVGVTLELSADEALVLFEWLARTSDAGHPMPFADEAERRVLGNVLCLLERVLVEPFSAEYDSLLQAARSRLNDGFSVDQ